ncbi:MAG: protein kinase [Planctomycetes bacterium]|nr:protein kinase [Planctomycetota bacterium]
MIQPSRDDGLFGEGTAADPVLAECMEELTRRVQAGEPADPESFARAHPEHAEEIRRVFPVLEMLARLESPPTDGSPYLATGGPPARVLGDFRLLEEIGRGGMGIVYRAEQISLGRTVALKVLPFAAVLDEGQVRRFKQEAQAAAQLHHTNIVPVFCVGQERGVHYYSMQYIEGQSLAEAIGELRRLAQPQGRPQSSRAPSSETLGPLSPGPAGGQAYMRSVAQLGLEAAQALAHAHELGIIHRDVKPANLLLDRRGHLWLTDFGLAHCRADSGLTVTGDVVGTLRYMSPEQALGRRAAIDERTDVYSLGATLYELLTLEPACAGRDRAELLRRIAFEEPRPPRALNRAVPADLETIVLKAMEKEPADRYSSVAAMAEDLERFLEERPIAARRPGATARALRWCRRHRGATALLAVIVVLLAATVSLALGQYQSRRLEERERRERAYAEAVLREKLKLLRCETVSESSQRQPAPDRRFFLRSDSSTFGLAAVVEEAIASLARLASEMPQRFEAHYHLARGLRLLGRPAEALARVEEALELEPAFVPAWVLAAELRGAGVQESMARVARWLELEPPGAWQREWFAAERARREGKWPEAARSYETLLARERKAGELYPGSSIDLRLALGLARLEARAFHGAIAELIVARHDWPELLEPALLLGRAYLLRGLEGDREEALRTFEKLFGEAASRDEAATWIAITLASAGATAEAVEWARKVAEPRIGARLRAWCLLARLGRRSRADYEAGAEAAREALAVAPGDTVAMVLLAQVTWARHVRQPGPEREAELAEVERLSRRVLAADPENAEAYALLSDVARERGDPEGALELSARALELAPELWAVRFQRNSVLWREGRNEELAGGLEEAEVRWETFGPRDKAYWTAVRAELLARKGRFEEAVAEYGRAVELDPGMQWAAVNRCWLLLNMGRHATAAECFRSSTAPGHPSLSSLYRCGLARALEGAGRIEEAARVACDALLEDPSDHDRHDLLLELAWHGEGVLPADLDRLVRALAEAAAAEDDPVLLRTLAFLRIHSPSGRDLEGARSAISRALAARGEPDAETLAIRAEVEHASGEAAPAIRTLEEALRLPDTSRWHAARLGLWRREASPDLVSCESIDAALAAQSPGGAADLELLVRFGRVPSDPGADGRLAYLEGRVLERRGLPGSALERFLPLAAASGPGAPEPHLRLAAALDAAGRPEEAEAALRRPLEDGASRREIWDAWLAVALARPGASARALLADFPCAVRGAEDPQAYAEDARWLLEQLSAGEPLGIDCGGSQHEGPSGERWSRDRFFLGGRPEHTPATIRGSRDEQLYRTLRELPQQAARPGYRIPLPRGSYAVALHFCEGDVGASGLRVFDVILEGETRLPAYDGFARDGFGTAVRLELEVEVSDGALDIELRAHTPHSGPALIAAIEVRRV